MTINLQTIREGVEARLQDAFSANGLSITIHPWLINDDVYPIVTVMPGSPLIEYHTTYGQGLSQINLIIEVRTTAADPISAQIALSRFTNAGTGEPRSIIDALEATLGGNTPTLNGVVENVMVVDCAINNGEQLGSGVYEFAATFNVQILARRN